MIWDISVMHTDLAVDSGPARGTHTLVSVLKVQTGAAILAWEARTLVDICIVGEILITLSPCEILRLEHNL